MNEAPEQQRQETTMVNVIEYEGLTLLVSNKGQIYTNDGVELKQTTITNKRTGYENKYIYVTVYNPTTKKMKRVQVSRLVCMAFHPIENPELYQVDHIDSNPQNNRASNLRFVTRKFNNSRRHTRRLKSQNYRSTSHRHEFLRAENAKTGEVRYFKNGMDASSGLGCSHVLIYNVITGKFANTAKGWKLQWISRDAEEATEFRRDLELKAMQKELRKANMRLNEKLERQALKAQMRARAKELRQAQIELLKRNMNELKFEQKAKAHDEVASRHAIVQTTLDGEFVREWKNVREAMSETGLTTIWNCVKGRQASAGGFIWKFKNENED